MQHLAPPPPQDKTVRTMNGRPPHLDSKIESEKINRVQSHGEKHPVHKYGGRGLRPV